MRMIYGYDVKDSKNDRFLGLLMGSVEGLGVAVSPVGQLFDAYPICKYTISISSRLHTTDSKKSN